MRFERHPCGALRLGGRSAPSHEAGAYFTNLGPKSPNLAIKIRVPREKLSHVFAVIDEGDLRELPGERGEHIFFAHRGLLCGEIASVTLVRERSLNDRGDGHIVAAAGGDPLSDVIIRRMGWTWPEGVYQDGDSADLYDLFDPWVMEFGPRSREFFVYQDRESAESWNEHGAIPENANKMLHFLIGAELPEPQRLAADDDRLRRRDG